MRLFALPAALLLLTACASPTIERMKLTDIEECTGNRARDVAITEVTANPERYHFACVRVQGLTSGPHNDDIVTISESQKAAYQRDETVYWRNRGSRSIGVMAWDGVEALPAFQFASITGIVIDCRIISDGLQAQEGAWRAADLVGGSDDEMIILPGGFCHFSSDPHIRANEVRILPVSPPPPRLLPRDRASLIGNLVPAPANWKWRQHVEELARKFLDVLRKRDFATFPQLHVEFTDEGWNTLAINSATQLQDGAFAAFGRLMQSSHTPQILIAPYVWYYMPYRLDPKEGSFTSVVCYCLTLDCRSSWPIQVFDADNRPDRPYACLEIEQQFWGVEREEVAAIKIRPAARSGFPEPQEGRAP